MTARRFTPEPLLPTADTAGPVAPLGSASQLLRAARHHDGQAAPAAPGIVGNLPAASSPLGQPTASDPAGRQTR